MDIFITPYTSNDTDELYQLVVSSAEHLRPWMPWLHENYSREDTQSWVELCVRDWELGRAFRYLAKSSNGSIVGTVGLDQIDSAHKICELGYWVGSSALNRGVATQACLLAAKAAFEHYGLMRIQINILTDNAPSNRVALKLGATFEGTVRNRLYHNERSRPANVYSLIPIDVE